MNVSLIRSTVYDVWSEKQMAMMKHGGNQPLCEFFDKYNLNEEEIKTKYTTVAAQYYRKKLLALANGQSLMESEPQYEEGR